MSKPKIILPDFVRLVYIFDNFRDLRRTSPEAFEDYTLGGVHGVLNELYWHEKSRMSGNASPEQHGIRFKSERDMFTKRKYPIFLDFSNPLLNDFDCLDRYGDKALINFENEINVVILSTDALLHRVRENFPQFKICWKFFENFSVSDIIAKLNDVEFVLLPTSVAYDDAFINTVPLDLRSRCIFTVNDMCSSECPKFSEHLTKSAEIACSMDEERCSDFCSLFYGRMNEDGRTTYLDRLSHTKITEELYPLGYEMFYIDSCSLSSYHFIKETVKALVKEEYQLDLFELLCYIVHVQDELHQYCWRNK